MKKLAVLDFDGTLYRGDSMRDFALFSNPLRYYVSLLKLIVPYIGYLTGAVSRNSLKSQFLKNNFSGIAQSEMEQKGKQFYRKNRSKLYPSAISWIQREREEHTQLLVLSGSCKEWLQPFCEEFGAHLIATEMTYENEICTGKIKGSNLVGSAKKEALKTYLQMQEPFNYSIAFGDKKSDSELAEMVDEFHLNYFY